MDGDMLGCPVGPWMMDKAPTPQPSPGATQGHCACHICAVTGTAAAAAAPKKGEIKMKGSGVRCIHLHLSFERFVRTKEVLSSLSKVCNASPAGFHLRCLIDTLMSMMGKVVGAARGPLCKGFKTLSVLQLMRGAGVRSGMGALYRLMAATLHSGGALHPLPFVPRPAMGRR